MISDHIGSTQIADALGGLHVHGPSDFLLIVSLGKLNSTLPAFSNSLASSCNVSSSSHYIHGLNQEDLNQGLNKVFKYLVSACVRIEDREDRKDRYHRDHR